MPSADRRVRSVTLRARATLDRVGGERKDADVADDSPRFLHRTSGYTSNPLSALPGEPEAISADAEAELAWNAERDRRHELGREWTKARSRILGAVEHFEVTARPPQRLQRTLRAIRRETAAIDRDVDAGA
jgi:hypothetical protein